MTDELQERPARTRRPAPERRPKRARSKTGPAAAAQAAAQEAKPIPPAPSRPPRMPIFASLSSNLRELVFNLFVLLLVALLVPVVLGQFWRNEVVIEPIAVPDQLRTLGLTPEVASARLVDALREVDAAGGSALEAVNVVASTDRVDFSIPDSGLSIDSFIYYVRRFFGIEETRIGGEFRCSDAECTASGVSLRLRVNSGGTRVIQMPPMRDASEAQYFFDAAVRAMEQFQPVIAVAALVDSEPTRAEVIALNLVRARSPHAHWAHNLIGIIKAQAGEPDIAIEEFRAALALAPHFLPTRVNLAATLGSHGKLEEARRLFGEVLRAEPQNAQALEGLGDLARQEGHIALALEHYRQAAAAAPTLPRYYTKPGMMLLAAGRTEEGLALLQEALRVDPADPAAFAYLAAHYQAGGDFAAAAPLYRRAADYQPENPQMQDSAALNLLMLRQYDDALARSDKAIALEPDNVDYRKRRADALTGLGRHLEAQAELQRAAALAPERADIAYSRARNFEQLGRRDEAIANYKRVIELDPEGNEAAIAGRFLEIFEAEAIRAPANRSNPLKEGR